MRHDRFAATAMLALCAVCAPVQASTVWDEALQGDLSSNGLAPTQLPFAVDTNTVIGSVSAGDPDYLSFVVPAGHLLSGVWINPGTSVSGASSFFAIQAGPQVTYPAGGVGALLAFNHYTLSDVGTNFLLASLLPPGSAGLGAGTYAVWLNETGGTVPYSFSFVISPVPEPAAGWLLCAGLGLLAAARGRRSNEH
jgi:hypothetical protein